MWQNGKQHGEGQYILPDGTTRRGVWKNGKRIQWLDEEEEDQGSAPQKEENTRTHEPSPRQVIEENVDGPTN